MIFSSWQLRFGLRRVTARPIQFSISVLAISISIAVLISTLACFRTLLGQISAEASPLVITGSLDSNQLSYLLTALAAVAEIRPHEQSNKISIYPKPSVDREALAVSIQSAIDPNKVNLKDQSFISISTKRLVLTISANIVILLSLLALLCCLVILGNSELNLLEAKKDLQIMSLVGVSRIGRLKSLAIEYILLAIVGSSIGLILGYLSQELTAKFVIDSTATLAKDLEHQQIKFNFYDILIAFGLGFTLSCLAPVLLMLAKEFSAMTPRKKPVYYLYPVVLLLIVATACLASSRWQPASFISSILIVSISALVSLILLTKLLDKCRVSQRITKKLAAGFLQQYWRWTLFPQISISAGLSIIIGLGIMNQSYEGSFSSWLDRTLNNDLYLRSTINRGLGQNEYLQLETINALRNQDQIKDLNFFSSVLIKLSENAALVGSFSEGIERTARKYQLKESIDELEFEAGSLVMVNEVAAKTSKLQIGTTLVLGGRTRKIAAIFRDFGNQIPFFVVSDKSFKRDFPEGGIVSAAFNTTSEEISSSIQSKLPKNEELLSREILVNNAMYIFHSTFRITQISKIFVYILFSTSTFLFLLSIVIQKKRELKLMQILGADLALQFNFISSLALYLLLPGIISGSVFGLLLAAILVFRVNPDSFGWSIDFILSWNLAIEVLLLSLATTALAALTAFLLTKTKIDRTSILGVEHA